MKLMSLSSAATLFVLAGSLALAQQPGPMPHHAAPGHDSHANDSGRALFRIAPPGMWWKNPSLIQKLTLTADQQKRMDDIFQQSRLKLIDLKADVEKQDVVLEPMLDANPPDTAKVVAQINHVAQSRAALEEAVARMLLGIRTVLTPDQWTKLQAEEHARRSEPTHRDDRRWQGGRGNGQPNGVPRGRPGPAGNNPPQLPPPPA
jgi:Spy/CpxP family protein refolding chaperone